MSLSMLNMFRAQDIEKAEKAKIHETRYKRGKQITNEMAQRRANKLAFRRAIAAQAKLNTTLEKT